MIDYCEPSLPEKEYEYIIYLFIHQQRVVIVTPLQQASAFLFSDKTERCLKYSEKVVTILQYNFGKLSLIHLSLVQFEKDYCTIRL